MRDMKRWGSWRVFLVSWGLLSAVLMLPAYVLCRFAAAPPGSTPIDPLTVLAFSVRAAIVLASFGGCIAVCAVTMTGVGGRRENGA